MRKAQLTVGYGAGLAAFITALDDFEGKDAVKANVLDCTPQAVRCVTDKARVQSIGSSSTRAFHASIILETEEVLTGETILSRRARAGKAAFVTVAATVRRRVGILT